MTVGDPKVTSSGKFNGQKGLKFVCLQNKSTRFPELDVFPTQPCPAGIMTVHHFPTFVPHFLYCYCSLFNFQSVFSLCHLS